jgi:hypothetical protein
VKNAGREPPPIATAYTNIASASSAAKPEARSTLLAYAFARSMRYAVCERSDKPIDCKRVAAICSSLTGQKTEPEAIAGWYKESLVAKKLPDL